MSRWGSIIFFARGILKKSAPAKRAGLGANTTSTPKKHSMWAIRSTPMLRRAIRTHGLKIKTM
jgi:hypothetical protein